MEFIQFHPTALYPAEEHAFLISEAVRGEGAVLRNWEGEAFMARYDTRKDLAPRDIVARAVHSELKRSDEPHVWLDATDIAADHLEERFPQILESCRSRGVDPCRDPIPVVPAAHYTCGGIWTDGDGRTGLAGLYAAGECACTGVHGANRLASNSLLEAIVFAQRAAAHLLLHSPRADAQEPAGDDRPPDLSGFPAEPLAHIRSRLRGLMWDCLGIVRSSEEMRSGASQLNGIRREWQELAGTPAGQCDGTRWTEAAELRNMLDVAGLIIRCALWRRESRGLHFVIDHPERDNESYLRDSLVPGSD
jgi:L-aspartate oxidase